MKLFNTALLLAALIGQAAYANASEFRVDSMDCELSSFGVPVGKANIVNGYLLLNFGNVIGNALRIREATSDGVTTMDRFQERDYRFLFDEDVVPGTGEYTGVLVTQNMLGYGGPVIPLATAKCRLTVAEE